MSQTAAPWNIFRDRTNWAATLNVKYIPDGAFEPATAENPNPYRLPRAEAVERSLAAPDADWAPAATAQRAALGTAIELLQVAGVGFSAPVLAAREWLELATTEFEKAKEDPGAPGKILMLQTILPITPRAVGVMRLASGDRP